MTRLRETGPGLPAHVRQAAPSPPQLPHALRRAGADPLDGLEHRLPVVLLELRPARLLPRDRARLPAGAPRARPLPARAGGARRSWSSFVLVFPVEIRRSAEGVIYFGELQSEGPPRALTLTVIFVAVAATMAFIGEGVARTFARFRALEAYRLDLFGSLLGVAAFAALSFLSLPPVAWGIVVARRLRRAAGQTAAGARAAWPSSLWWHCWAVESVQPDTRWSPYYKVTLDRHEDEPGSPPEISVNGIPHQVILSSTRNPLYARPYERTAPGVPKDKVLIIGAGSGNDVAIALAQGARHVDAVEIDQRLVRARPRAAPRPALLRSSRGRPHHRRAGVPRALGRTLRPHPARAARLAHAGGGPVVAATRELPVHQAGDRGGARPPHPGRGVRDVQLLPRAVAHRPLRQHARPGVRPTAVRRQLRRRGAAGGADHEPQPRFAQMRHPLGERHHARPRAVDATITPSRTCASPAYPASTSRRSWPS